MKKVSRKIISFVTIICLFATIVIPAINTYAVEGVAREPWMVTLNKNALSIIAALRSQVPFSIVS